ncbi:hypothetical protein DM02DRAFT_677302 [Periconia macrospinosa]|uniref:NACHT domain-containing protein n=1 Tax=Periconia macrospinosa TaxID=97972 RepID=A0A2V1D3W2_9PLEO|nr:hypothetical protein DM02DRAFT_677302 [Periconia macrospinosa]
MRLLRFQDDGEFSLVNFYDEKTIPPYAILSHTWEKGHEVLFQDIQNGTGKDKKGHKKIKFCEKRIRTDDLQYCWIDTCCIDKSSSSEETKSINSMYRWYQKASKCYVYLADVSVESSRHDNESLDDLLFETALRQSRWFSRGWTLQELLAPPVVEFFSSEGKFLGDKRSLELQIHGITGISIRALQGRPMSEFNIPERISWAAKRQTTVEEDQVYCLLGIFEVYMPVIYGEGLDHAFKRLRKELSAYAPRLTEPLESNETEACLANLSATDQKQFLDQMLRRSRNSCAWIFSNNKFTAWYDANRPSLLSIAGKAGCGKTTLAANIIHAIFQDQSHTKEENHGSEIKAVVLSFFFRDSNQEAENTGLAALRTLTSQLVLQVPCIFPTLLKRHRRLSAKGAFEWSWETLSVLLSEMLEQTPLSSRVFLILDAIDECEKKSRNLILGWVKMLADETSSSNWRTANTALKVLITNRPDSDIHDQLYHFPILAISEMDTKSDIRGLIRSRMEEFTRRRNLDPTVTQGIIRYMESHAQGMFLWVVLILEELERRDQRLSDEAILYKLSSIPLSLDNTYRAILHNIIPTRKEDMWRIIRWLLYGSRSLTLAELEVALCLETGASSWYGFAADVEFLLGSLIRIEGPRKEVNFVHQTARGFLEAFAHNAASEEVAGLAMDTTSASDHLANICIQYLLHNPDFAQLHWQLRWVTGYAAYADTIQEFLRQRPFIRYAVESWALHTRAALTPSPALFSRVCRLLSLPDNGNSLLALEFFIRKHGSWAVPEDPTPLHLTAYFNLPRFTEFFVSQHDGSVDVENTMEDTPLVWAAEMGSTECVKILIRAGADPNYYEADDWSALHWAARNGHTDVAILLMENGASVTHTDSRGHTPLDWALDRGFMSVAAAIWRQIDKERPGEQSSPPGEREQMGKEMDTLIVQNAWRLWDYRP